MLYLTTTPDIPQKEAQYIKRMSNLTNIIPIITKGDHITKDEILQWKLKLNMISEDFGVEWFNCREVSTTPISTPTNPSILGLETQHQETEPT